jgi:hypothetical protein
MGTAILFICLLAAGFGFAAVFYVRRHDNRAAAIFLVLRVLLVLLLLLAFFEPVITFDRLETRPRTIPVLVDASMSMRLFYPESTVIPFVRSLDSLGSAGPAGPRFRFYRFGDSLRACPASEVTSFSDLQSFLPVADADPVIRDAPFVLVVSDGNFSNTSLSHEALQDKACYYLELPRVSPWPYLQTEILGARESVPVDSASAVTARIRGYAPHRRSFSITCRNQGVLVSRRTIVADSGYFADTAEIRLPTGRQGRFVYTVLVENAADTLRSALYFSQSVVPQKFLAIVRSAAPLLDRRFFTMALQSDPQWRIVPHDAPHCDALFLFDYADTMAPLLRSLDSRGVAVFLGAFPCAGRQDLTPAAFSLAPSNPYDTLFARFCSMDVAPPSRIPVCRPPFLTRSRTVLSCRARVEGQSAVTADSIPFLTTGTFQGRSAVAVAGRELWRIDFLPLAVAKEGETPGFIRCATAFIKNRLVSNLRENLAAYPSAAELFEHDSIPVAVLLPADLDAADMYGGNAGPAHVFEVRFTIDLSGKKIVDSLFALAGIDPQNKAQVKLPPLPAGAYRFTCSAVLGGRQRSFSDSLYVGASSPELSARAQNTVLLNQFAIPLKSGNAREVLPLYGAHAVGKRATVSRYLQLRQTWILLALIIALLTAEWVVRRKKGLD